MPPLMRGHVDDRELVLVSAVIYRPAHSGPEAARVGFERHVGLEEATLLRIDDDAGDRAVANGAAQGAELHDVDAVELEHSRGSTLLCGTAEVLLVCREARDAAISDKWARPRRVSAEKIGERRGFIEPGCRRRTSVDQIRTETTSPAAARELVPRIVTGGRPVASVSYRNLPRNELAAAVAELRDRGGSHVLEHVVAGRAAGGCEGRPGESRRRNREQPENEYE